jgi:O-antigen/teichoic acid export membrane protein
MPVSEKRVIARNTLANAVVKFLQLASAFVFMPFLIRGFGLANYGLYVLAGSLSVYLSLLDLGVNATVIKRVSEYRARGDEEGLGELIASSTAYYAFVGVVVCAFMAVFAQVGLGVFHLTKDNVDLARNLFTVAAVVALFSWPLGIGQAVLSGLQRYDLGSLVTGAGVFANLAVTALVVVTHDGPVVLLAGVGLVTLAQYAVAWLLAWRELHGVRISLRQVSLARIQSVLSFGWMIVVIQFAVVITEQQTDRIVLAVFTGATAIGLYEAAAKLSGLVNNMAALPVSALMPASSQMAAQERPEAVRALYLRGTKYSIAFAAPIAVGLMTLAQPLLLTWLGPAVAMQALAARVALIQWLLYLNLAVAFTIFIGTGRLTFLFRYTLTQAFLNLALSLVLVRPLGVLGVVLGTAISEAVMFPFGIRYALDQLEVSAGEYLRRVVVRTYPLLLVTVAVGVGGIALGLTQTLVGVAVVGLASVGACWLSMFAFGLEANEREDVRRLVGVVAERMRR